MTVFYRNKTFVVSNNPYLMTVFEQTKEGKTIKRTYANAKDISAEDKADLFLARAVKSFGAQEKVL